MTEETVHDGERAELDENEARAALEARIAARLSTLDDATLRRLDDWTAAAETPPATPPAAPGAVSRRQFLTTVAVGGVALVASNAATALLALDRGADGGETRARTELMPQLTRLRDLLALYERLENVPLDSLVRAGISAVGLVLRALRQGADLLNTGIGLVEMALARVEAALAILREGTEFVEGIVDSLIQRVTALWALLSEVTGIAIPIAESVAAFFSNILEKIPFGVGAKIKQIIEWLQELVASLPDGLANIKARLLAPLRSEWVDSASTESLEVRLLSPLRANVLEPGRQMVAEIENLASQWETQLEKPVQSALEERAAIRAQISAYRRQYRI